MGGDMKESEQFKKGLDVRRAVLGADYVDGSLAKADEFMMAFQEITTEWCWGYAWTRPGLERKTRSMLNLAMLTALGKPAELRLHVKGAVANGVPVVGLDPLGSARQAFAQDGGAVAASAQEAAAGVDVLITMLPDGKAVRAALVGAEPLVPRLGKDAPSSST